MSKVLEIKNTVRIGILSGYLLSLKPLSKLVLFFLTIYFYD